MKRIILPSLLIILIPLSASFYAAESDKDKNFKIRLRRSGIDKNKIEEPAQIQYTKPDKGDSSCLVDAGLTISYVPDSLSHLLDTSGLLIEYHRNTQIEKEQNTLKCGLKCIGIFGDISRGFAHYVHANLNFKREKVKDWKSGEILLRYTPIITILNIDQIKGPEWIKMVWRPTLGLDYENVYDAPNNGVKGNVLRGVGEVVLELYPFATKMDHRLVISVLIAYWHDVSKSEGFNNTDDSHPLFNAGISYYLDPGKHVAIGVNYVNGENPTEGLKEQKYTQVGIKIKF